MVLNNVQLTPLNQSYKKVDLHPGKRNGYGAIFLTT